MLLVVVEALHLELLQELEAELVVVILHQIQLVGLSVVVNQLVVLKHLVMLLVKDKLDLMVLRRAQPVWKDLVEPEADIGVVKPQQRHRVLLVATIPVQVDLAISVV